MSNILGNLLKISIFGESHGDCVGVTIDGLPGGVKIDRSYISSCLDKRRPSSKGETKRIEKDEFDIISGEFNGFSTGTPLTILIKNENKQSKDYDANKNLARPGHADYVAHVKYNGYEDYRGGGHFSGRISAALVAGGALILSALDTLGVKIGSHILELGGVKDCNFDFNCSEIDKVNSLEFPVINDVKNSMLKEMELAADSLDSIGGVIETAITGLPVGLGEPMFDSLEGMISKAMFAIGAIKGIEFGEGFAFKNLKGSTSNDQYCVSDGVIKTLTNHNGGINGGISNGMPLRFNVVVKPTPSISLPQKSVDFNTLAEKEIVIKGRHDPCIVRRINIVVRAMTALVVADALMEKYGRDVLIKGF